MSTGYTATLMEKGQTFQEFAVICARAFGALVTLRDEPLDAPVPEEFVPDEYYTKALKSAKKRYSEFKVMSAAQAEKYGASLKQKEITSAEKYIAKEKLENERLATMEARVKLWKPPTKDHVGLKDFMLEQIRVSYTDYYSKKLKEIKEKSPKSFWEQELSTSSKDILYYEKELQKENDRCTTRTDWIKQLRDSLKG